MPFPSAKKFTLCASRLCLQACITKASLTEIHHISLMPFASNSENSSSYAGTCLVEQVGVNAPGNPKITTLLSLKISVVSIQQIL